MTRNNCIIEFKKKQTNCQNLTNISKFRHNYENSIRENLEKIRRFLEAFFDCYDLHENLRRTCPKFNWAYALPPVASHCELSRTCVPLFPESAVENSFKVATLALLPAAHHQLCLASQATRCDSQQKRTRLSALFGLFDWLGVIVCV